MTWFTKPPLGTPLDWGNPLNKGTVLAFAMNEGHGDKVQDLSMNGNHGTLNNFAYPPTVASGWNPGKVGVGLNFDGTNDYVNCGNQASLKFNSTQSFTIQWMSKRNTADAGERIIKRAHNYYGWSGAGTYLMTTYDGINSAVVTVPMGVDVWGTFTFVFDRGSGILSGYVNGILEDTDNTLNTVGYVFNNDPLLIGGVPGTPAKHFNGHISYVRIMNRAWSAKEVRDYAMNPWKVYLDV